MFSKIAKRKGEEIAEEVKVETGVESPHKQLTT